MNNDNNSNVVLLTGSTLPELAEKISKILEIELSPVKLGKFANGEISCKLTESVRGRDVFIIQTHGGNEINDSIMEQLIMIDAAKRASARSITAVCPFFGYARQDRKASGREPITTRLIVDMLSVAGADRIMSIDLHSGQSQGFFDGPFDHLIAAPVLKDYIRKNIANDNMVIVSPDAGRVKSAERYASSLGCPMAIIHKQRSHEKHNTVEAKHLIGNVEGMTCVVIDDIIDTAGTICAAADLLAEKGAKEVYGLTTHGIFSDPALQRINDSAFKQVVATNTLPIKSGPDNPKIVVVSIAPLLASAIKAVYEGLSVSALFDGQNQF